MRNRRFPYGYEMVNGEICVCKAEAGLLRNIFLDYIGGKALKDIAGQLTEQAVEYLPGECRWNRSRIKRMIEDRRYLGDETYPRIMEETLFQQANAVKSDRRTTGHYVVHSENKALVYAVRCAGCGERLHHKTDATRTGRESWYCKTSGCKAVVRMNVDTLEQEVTAILNRVIRHPSLADRAEDEAETETPIAVRKMENEIRRALEQLDFDKEAIQKNILQCASMRYDAFDSQKHITERLKAEFERSAPLSCCPGELFDRTVAAVLLSKDGAVTVRLKNGNLVGKEEDTHGGTDNGNAEGGEGDTSEAGIQRAE